VVAGAALLVTYAMPHVIGTSLSAIGRSFETVSAPQMTVLCMLWAAGLLVHSFVLTGALPGLTRRRALTLNLTGSAVANVLPFGGAAGMGLNYVMIRSWSVSAAGFASYTFVSNLCVIVLKLTIPTVALAVLLGAGGQVNGFLGGAAAMTAALLGLVAGAAVLGLSRPEWTQRAVDRLTRVVTAGARLIGRRPSPEHLAEWLLDCRTQTVEVLRRKGRQMSLGMVGYALLQALLLGASAHVVAAGVGPAQVLAAFAVDRVLTLAVLTPGGLGFAETGTAGGLVAFGAPPAAAAAAVLLYRGFTYALEIPVGGTWLAGWLLARRLRPDRAG